MIENILTIDCEDWYHTRTAQKYLSGKKGVFAEGRISSNVRTLLDLFGSFGARGTFFVLGEVVEKFPELVMRIDKTGHRIGAHGYKHVDVFSMDKQEFESDVSKVTGFINSLVSRPVESFRAPNWSINNDCLWALEILKKYDYKYDSSSPKMLSLLKNTKGDQIIEIPRSGAQFFRLTIPLGGAFLRVYPFGLMMRLMKKINQDGFPFMLYIHPWEIDAGLPLIRTSRIDRVIQYYDIKQNLEKIRRILDAFKFIPVEDFFEKNEVDKNLLNTFYQLG